MTDAGVLPSEARRRELSLLKAAPHPLQRRCPSPGGEVVDPVAAPVIHLAGLEPAHLATDHPVSVGRLDHQLLDQVHHHGDDLNATQVQTEGS